MIKNLTFPSRNLHKHMKNEYKIVILKSSNVLQCSSEHSSYGDVL